MQNQYRLKSRQGESFGDNLKIYKARIYKMCGPNDDRIQVRIIPHMIDIPSDELDYLPKYPPFFKGQVVSGKTEIDDGKNFAEHVWVAATPDFTFGFVIGLANAFGQFGGKMIDSYNFMELKKYLVKRRICPDDFSYKDLTVQFWSEFINNEGESLGGILEFINKKYGHKYILTTSGTIFALTTDSILLRVGGVNTEPLGGTKFSSLEMTPGKTRFKTPVFEVDAGKVILGKRSLSVLATTASSKLPIAVNGANLYPCENVMI